MLTKFVEWSFTDPEYLPAHLTFMEPGKYKHNDTKAILRHWRDRQEEGKIAFLWTHILDGSRKVKATYKDHMLEGKPAPAAPGVPMLAESAISPTTSASADQKIKEVKTKGAIVGWDSEGK